MRLELLTIALFFCSTSAQIQEGPFGDGGTRQLLKRKEVVKALPFLKYANEQTRNDVIEVVKENQLTLEEKEEIISDLVARDRQVVQNSFRKFQKMVKEKRDEQERRYRMARSRMSKNAQEADEVIDTIMKDPSVPSSQKEVMVREVFDRFGDKVRKELLNVHSGLQKAAHRVLRHVLLPILGGRRNNRRNKNRQPEPENRKEEDGVMNLKMIQSAEVGNGTLIQF